MIAFAAGVLSFFSTRTAPLGIGFAALITIAALRGAGGVKKSMLRRLFPGDIFLFILGFSLFFLVAGLPSLELGKAVLFSRGYIRLAGGIFILIIGLKALGMPVPGALDGFGPAGSFFAGLSFSSGWEPYPGKILTSLTIFSNTAGNIWTGGGLYLAYASGFGLLLLLAGLSFYQLVEIIPPDSRAAVHVSRVAGLVIVLLGILIVFNRLCYYVPDGPGLFPI